MPFLSSRLQLLRRDRFTIIAGLACHMSPSQHSHQSRIDFGHIYGTHSHVHCITQTASTCALVTPLLVSTWRQRFCGEHATGLAVFGMHEDCLGACFADACACVCSRAAGHWRPLRGHSSGLHLPPGGHTGQIGDHTWRVHRHAGCGAAADCTRRLPRFLQVQGHLQVSLAMSNLLQLLLLLLLSPCPAIAHILDVSCPDHHPFAHGYL